MQIVKEFMQIQESYRESSDHSFSVLDPATKKQVLSKVMDCLCHSIDERLDKLDDLVFSNIKDLASCNRKFGPHAGYRQQARQVAEVRQSHG
jgi:hypothetical protein